MTVTRRGGLTGKICIECKLWKPLIEFGPDRSPGKFKGYRKDCCILCEKALKNRKT